LQRRSGDAARLCTTVAQTIRKCAPDSPRERSLSRAIALAIRNTTQRIFEVNRDTLIFAARIIKIISYTPFSNGR
jgi:hypothetical protein